MKNIEGVIMPMNRLLETLERIDKKGYKAYKDIQGSYTGGWFKLHIDHVQGDPFAAPSRIRVFIGKEKSRLHPDWYGTPYRKTALEDFFAREIAARIRQRGNMSRGSGKSGQIFVDEPGQEVLPRTAVKVDGGELEIRLSVGLPARGRTILGQEAKKLLSEEIPGIVEAGVFHYSQERLEQHLELADQQHAIRRFLEEKGYIAFIANGSILPRESGVSNRPLRNKGQVIPFQSPPSLEIEIPVPHREPIRGMGIRPGVTLIVGGGFHGKSTLLKAIERGVYNHIPGDGREYVITVESACKIRAEDGRRVEKVNISPFINNLPFGKDTVRFSTDNASGSTSQAANIMEMLEAGARVLLVDEDTSATNFMIRDARMQRLVRKEQEPITPFVDKIRSLYEQMGVSTILVLGGSGDYFDVADTVILMNEYVPEDVTQQAKRAAEEIKAGRLQEGTGIFGEVTRRIPAPSSFDSLRGNRAKSEAKGLHTILMGHTAIDLSLVEQLVDPSQTRAIAQMLHYLGLKLVDGKKTMVQLVDALYHEIQTRGLDAISPFKGKHPGDMALARKYELIAAINRMRTLKIL